MVSCMSEAYLQLSACRKHERQFILHLSEASAKSLSTAGLLLIWPMYAKQLKEFCDVSMKVTGNYNRNLNFRKPIRYTVSLSYS